MTKRMLLALLSAGYLGLAQAGTINIEDTLSYVYPTTGGYTITFNTGSNPISTCNGGKRYAVALSHPNYDAVVSTILAAHVSKEPVRIYVDDTQSPTCAPLISGVLVREF